MALFRPKYTDKKTGERKQAAVWWYDFIYAGRRICESAKTTRKTIAKEAEKKRRLELEHGFNATEDKRRERSDPWLRSPRNTSLTTKCATVQRRSPSMPSAT